MKISKRTIKIFIFLIIVILTAILVQAFRMELFNKFLKIRKNNEIKADINFLDDSIPLDYNRIILGYSDDLNSERVYKNTLRVFKMAKLNFEDYDITTKDFDIVLDSLKSDDILVISSEKIEEIKSKEKIKTFVKNGGGLVLLLKNTDKTLDEISGIRQNNGYLNSTISSLEFERDFFPGLDDLSFEQGSFLTTSALDLELDENASVIAKSKDGFPLIFMNEYGSGRVVYMNNNYLVEKSNRGLLLQMISLSKDKFIWTVFNGKIVDIDDFPAPIKIGYDEKIKSEYALTNRNFYRNIWWSFMHNLSQKHNIKYTGLIIGAYNLNVKMPLPDLNQVELEDLRYFGRKLNEDLGEVGIHGYNHNSLVLEGQMNFEDYGYLPWESIETMKESLIILKKGIKEIYGDINIYTYVPPSNILSVEGKQIIQEVFPEIRVLAGLYTGRDEQGVLYQEFEEDPDLKGVWNLPRLTAGYFYNKETMWAIYNGIAHYGIVNHFIHPDDLLDEERSNNKTWQKMSENLESIFADIDSNYPMLRPMTNYEAYNNLKALDELSVFTKFEENQITISHTNGIAPVYHILRLSKDKIKNIEGAEYTIIDKNLGLYLIEVKQPRVKIILR